MRESHIQVQWSSSFVCSKQEQEQLQDSLCYGGGLLLFCKGHHLVERIFKHIVLV